MRKTFGGDCGRILDACPRARTSKSWRESVGGRNESVPSLHHPRRHDSKSTSKFEAVGIIDHYN
jgi:hypothetical protein